MSLWLQQKNLMHLVRQGPLRTLKQHGIGADNDPHFILAHSLEYLFGRFLYGLVRYHCRRQ